MAELLQEYELSVWEDVSSGIGLGSFLEKKIAVIGSHKLHTPTKAYNVTLKENVNGEKTLTFSLPRAYRDKDGELKDNPFLSFLTAERKLKLRDGAEYDFFDKDGKFVPSKLEEEDTEERWTDYVIKTIDEDKESFVNNYTCKEVYVNELGKNGWSITLDSELKNNYGTLPELAGRVLEGSGWTVDEDSYVPMEKVAEPLFCARIVDGQVEATQMVSKESATLTNYVYTFYSQLQASADGTWHIKDGLTQLQVLWDSGNSFENHQLDDNRQIIDEKDEYNYLVDAASFTSEQKEWWENLAWQPTGVATDNVNAIQGGRIVESIYSHYEAVADKYVEEYTIKQGADVGLPDGVSPDAPVYHYTETEYLTSDMVKNYIVNASGYTALTGWKPDQNGPTIQTWAYNVKNTAAPTDGSIDKSINYLTLPHNTTIWNEGLKSNDFFLERDKQYVCRLKARMMSVEYRKNICEEGNTATNPVGKMRIRLRYPDGESTSALMNTPFDIDQSSTGIRLVQNGENIGYPERPKLRPEANSVACWVDEEGYYCGILTIDVANIQGAYGKPIRLCVKDITDTSTYPYQWHIEDIQLFDYVTDEEGKPVYPGDIPTAKAITTDHFYTIGLENGREIAVPLSVNKDNYEPKYNANYSAVRHIDIKESNYFNNVNSLAELFGAWVRFKVKHQKNGCLKSGDNKSIKFTRFASEKDETNWAGFKYGINLKSIKRNVESTAIASKVIVKNNNNEFAPAGMGSISRAVDNPTGENVIYNFDYYVAHGLLDQSTMINDLYGTTSAHFGYYYKLRELNDKLLPVNEKLAEMQGALDNAKQLLEYSQVQYESASEDYGMQATYYEQDKEIYKGSNDYDVKLAPRRRALGQLAAARNAAEKDIAIYEAQIAEYEQKIYGQEWQSNKTYAKGAVVKYVTTSSANHWYRSTRDDNRGEIPSYVPQSNNGIISVDKWELLDFKQSLDSDTIDQLPISAQADYWAEQKRQINDAFYRKYYRFIQEATWTDEKYMDDNLYYYDAVKVSAQNAWPKTKYTIGVIDVSGIERLAAYKFKVGQKSYVEDTEFFGYEYINVNGQQIKTPKKKEVVISERSRNFDDPSKSTITIQTYKNQFEELFSKLTATTQSLQYASGQYQKAANAVESDGSIKIESLEQAFANNSFMLANASNQLVTWDSGRGIEVADAKNPLEVTRITSGGIYVSNDGGISWQLGLSAGRGINTRLLTTGVISAEHVNIRSRDGSNAFTWTENGLTAFAPSGGGSKYVRFNDYGLFGTVRGSDLENAVKNAADFDAALAAIRSYSTFSLTWDGLLLNYQNGATSISSAGGLEIFHGEAGQLAKFPESYIISFGPLNPESQKYTVNDPIPIVSIGKFYVSPGEIGDSDLTSSEIHYGLRMRNLLGQITLDTDKDGNLWLRDSLTLGSVYGQPTAGINGDITQDAFWAKGQSGVFSVTHDGLLTANAVSISGEITATTLRIEGSSYIGSNLTIGNLTLNVPSNAPLLIETDESISEFSGDYDYRIAGINDSIENIVYELLENDSIGNALVKTQYTYWAGPQIAQKSLIQNIVEEDEDGNKTERQKITQYSIIQPRFSVDLNGYLNATNATIEGEIIATSGSFSGVIYASDGEFSGIINAKSGRINKVYFDNNLTSYIGEEEETEELVPINEEEEIQVPTLLSINEGRFLANKEGVLFADQMFLSYKGEGKRESGQNYLIAVGPSAQNPTNIFSVDKTFKVDKLGNITMSGTLAATNLTLDGDIALTGTFTATNGNNRIEINGGNGGYIRGYSSGSLIDEWRISSDGTALFNNVEVRGKISSVIFESNKTSAVGGDLLIAPAIYITKDQECASEKTEEGKYRYKLKNLDSNIVNIWSSIKRVQILKSNEDAIIRNIECGKDETTGDFYIDTDMEIIGGLTLGTQIISIDELINSIKLTASNAAGPRIIMSHTVKVENDNDTKTQQVVIGSLGGINTEYFGEFSESIHGLYADNAFITGKLYLPQAGITNETLEEGNCFSPTKWLKPDIDEDKLTDEIEIRFWAGASPTDRNNAPFIVTQDGSLYASKGVFKGQIIAENSSFAGTISASGIVLSHENDTDLDWENDKFAIQWLDEIEHDGQKCEFDIALFDNSGLTLYRGLRYDSLIEDEKRTLLYMQDTVDTPRIISSAIQTWNVYNDDYQYSSILNGRSLYFKYKEDIDKNFSTEIADNFVNNVYESPFSIEAFRAGAALRGSEKVQITSGDSILEVTQQQIGLNTTMNFNETMTVKTVADGLIFNFVGED